MDVPSLEPRRVQITTGSLPSPKLRTLATIHPFTRQERSLDLVFPSSELLENELVALETLYARGTLKLSDLLEERTTTGSNLLGAFTALSSGFDGEEDVWCIDERGLLTLSISKETYELLGLVGTKLPFKNSAERYVVRIPLQEHRESRNSRVKEKGALEKLDARRETEQGFVGWESWYRCANSEATTGYAATKGHQVKPVKCQSRRSPDVRIPLPTISPKPVQSADNDDLEDWNDMVTALFEWVGMACLGSQRLKVNDRVDPYVSIYELPAASRIGSITHLRWQGFLPSAFVQSIIDTSSFLATGPDSLSFVAITAHAFPVSPVSFIPPSNFTSDEALSSWIEEPARVPRSDAEDTWSLIVTPRELSTQGTESNAGMWIKAESIGQWDKRWG